MTQKNLLVLLVTALALVLTVQSVSAFGSITSVEVNGLEALNEDGSTNAINFANFAGDRLPVLVRFDAADNTEDVRIVAWISGERSDAVESSRFDTISGSTYTRVVYLDIPFDLNDDLHTSRKLEIVVESEEDGMADSKTIDLTVQRESYLVEVLAVDMQPEVKAGESLVIDVVLKNRGSHFAEDTFLRIRIPELGLETQTYFGDLAPRDQGGSVADKEDAVERRTYLRIPSDAPVGMYTVIVEAFNDDSFTTVEKRVLIAGAEEDTLVVPSSTSKTFSVDDEGIYKLTIVNRGSVIRVFDIVVDASTGLNVDISDSVVVVPAGSSRTVEFVVSSNSRDDYTFTAVVHSDGGLIVADETFSAHITDADGTGAGTDGGISKDNTAILLTVILAIVFVVLLIVLIVLLTRKPVKSEEFGESYY